MRSMRWECQKDGCFNRVHRLKLGVFDDCFPGKIGFGDIDAEVEINGYCLALEWKCYAGDIPKGQAIKFERQTFYGIDTVICVAGNAETMEVTHYGIFWLGKWGGWRDASLAQLKESCSSWAQWAKRQPRTTTQDGIMACVHRRYPAAHPALMHDRDLGSHHA